MSAAPPRRAVRGNGSRAARDDLLSASRSTSTPRPSATSASREVRDDEIGVEVVVDGDRSERRLPERRDERGDCKPLRAIAEPARPPGSARRAPSPTSTVRPETTRLKNSMSA